MGGGITTELVRNVFKSRSLKASDSHANSNTLEKRRWSTVRSYLCGDECNSIAADKDSASVRSSKAAVIQPEFSSGVAVQDSGFTWSSKPATRICELNSDFAEDFASVKSSEATVTQPIIETVDKEDPKNVKTEEEIGMQTPNSTLKLFQQEDAASIIQSAFGHYLARRDCSVVKVADGKEELLQCAVPSPESFGKSIKVQPGDSTDTSSLHEEWENVRQPIQKRVRAQVLKLQEDWDDSTVSSTISRKRIQNRVKAATRRERALADAFAQPLSVCSKKKRTKCNSLDSNSSLSWLERWMATREAENGVVDDYRNQRLGLRCCKQETMMTKKSMDTTVEERESCGSYEVSLQIDGISVAGQRRNDCFWPPKS